MELLHLFFSTLRLRPYVFVFFSIYLYAAIRAMGWKRAGAFTSIAWVVAFLAEFSSTRTGFPFGRYFYIEATRGKELWIANVPFIDSLSFTFLAYASYAMAQVLSFSGAEQIKGPRRVGGEAKANLLAVLLFVLLDVVIDPLALRGDKWFLGQIYAYPEPGFYFGVPLTNFLGWAMVGGGIIFLFQGVTKSFPEPHRPQSLDAFLGPGLYLLVLFFNLLMTFLIGEILLAFVGLMLQGPVLAKFFYRARALMGKEALA